MPALDKHDSPLPTTTVKWRFPAVHPEGRKYAVAVGAAATLCFFLHWSFLGWILAGLTIFWGTRMLIQWFYYSPALWRGNRVNTAVHLLSSMGWTYMTTTFAEALWVNLSQAGLTAR